MKYVAMIPARGGSKGVPDKNIKLLGGKPLMCHSLEAALNCSQVDEVYLNSDSADYLEMGREYGALSYFRPAEFATDVTSMRSVIIDFIDTLEERGKTFDALVLLYPVYPFRTGDDISHMINEYERIGGERPLVGMKEPTLHPYMCYNINSDDTIKPMVNPDVNKFYRRQTYPECYELTFWTCVLPTHSIKTLSAQLMNDHTYGYKIPDCSRIVDIDTEWDFQYAEFLLQQGVFKPVA